MGSTVVEALNVFFFAPPPSLCQCEDRCKTLEETIERLSKELLECHEQKAAAFERREWYQRDAETLRSDLALAREHAQTEAERVKVRVGNRTCTIFECVRVWLRVCVSMYTNACVRVQMCSLAEYSWFVVFFLFCFVLFCFFMKKNLSVAVAGSPC